MSSPDQDSPERRELEAASATRCLNCGHDLPGAYCPSCGQKDQPLRQPVHRFVVEAIAEYIGLDGRLWPTLGTLLFKPGRLTQAYVLGRRQQYVRPLRIYITASLLFFFLLALIDPVGIISGVDERDPMADTTMSVAAYASRVDSLLSVRGDRVERQRLVLDSVRTVEITTREALAQNSLAVGTEPDSLEALEDQLEEVEDEVEDAVELLDDLLASKTTQRLQWERRQLSSMRPDSSIRPADIDTAAEVLHSTHSGPVIGGPDWLFRGPAVQRLKRARTSAEQKDAAFALGRESLERVPTVVFLLMPVFALLLKLLYVRRGWYYSEHLVFALHVHAFMFAVFSATALLFWLAQDTAVADILGSLLALSIPIYFIVALKRVYAQGWVKTLIKTWLLSLVYGTVLIFGLVLAVGLAAAVA